MFEFYFTIFIFSNLFYFSNFFNFSSIFFQFIVFKNVESPKIYDSTEEIKIDKASFKEKEIVFYQNDKIKFSFEISKIEKIFVNYFFFGYKIFKSFFFFFEDFQRRKIFDVV